MTLGNIYGPVLNKTSDKIKYFAVEKYFYLIVEWKTPIE